MTSATVRVRRRFELSEEASLVIRDESAFYEAMGDMRCVNRGAHPLTLSKSPGRDRCRG
jgi:hypothetical protein